MLTGSFDVFETGDHLPLVLELFEEDLPHQMTSLDDLGIDDPIIYIDPFPPRQNNPLRPQNAHMLGKIRLAEANLLDQFSGGHLLVFQGINDLESFGIRKNLADIGMKRIYFFQTPSSLVLL
jgi:hypothetical protein